MSFLMKPSSHIPLLRPQLCPPHQIRRNPSRICCLDHLRRVRSLSSARILRQPLRARQQARPRFPRQSLRHHRPPLLHPGLHHLQLQHTPRHLLSRALTPGTRLQPLPRRATDTQPSPPSITCKPERAMALLCPSGTSIFLPPPLPYLQFQQTIAQH